MVTFYWLGVENPSLNQLVQGYISLRIYFDHIFVNTEVQLYSPSSMDIQESRSRNKLIILGEHGVNMDLYVMNEQGQGYTTCGDVYEC
jgi:hypothetical protein